MLPLPIIVVPGITASKLRDLYPLPPEKVWGVLGWKKNYNRVALRPQALKFEYQQPSIVRPDQLFQIAYQELIETLREELTYLADYQEVPVFPFAYDWRQPLEDIQQSLRAFIDEVIGRCSLMPHYHQQYGDNIKVNLIGHSMGGLVIARCLSDQPEPVPVNKIATLATPFQGSFEAIVKLVIGTGNLTGDNTSHVERRAARATPSLYQLLPGFPVAGMFDKALQLDPAGFTNPAAWQPCVVNFLTEYVARTNLSVGNAQAKARELFDYLLGIARANQQAIANLNLRRHGLNQNQWLAIAGVDTDTRVKLRVKKGARGKPEYVFNHSHIMNRWHDSKPTRQWRMTGDGTVPLQGAIPPFLAREKLILITPQDYGFWEIKDKSINALGGFHGILPNMDLVHRLLLRFFTNQSAKRCDKYNNTWGRALPDAVDNWNPPVKLGKPVNKGL